MSEPFWLSKLTPAELKLMHDLADVIRATGIISARGSNVAALVDQEIERRGNIQNDIILSESPQRADSYYAPLHLPSERRRRLRRHLS